MYMHMCACADAWMLTVLILCCCCCVVCAGITTIDTADNYGGSELLIGQHLRLNPEAALCTQVSRQ